MANRRITDLPAISSASINDDDLLMVVDVAEVDPGLKNKKLNFSDTKQYFNAYYLQLTGGTIAGSLVVSNNLTVSGSFSPVNITVTGSGVFNDIVVTGSGRFTNYLSGNTITGGSIQGLNINATTGNVTTLVVGTETVGTGTFTRISGITITGTSGLFTTGSFLQISGTTGLFSSLSGTNVTGVNIIGTTQISGAIVTGNTGRFSNITGVSGVFTTRLSGATITGDTVLFTTATGATGTFTRVSGTTVTGATGLFTQLTGGSGTFVQVSGTTITGVTGLFTNLTGSLGTFTNQISGATVTGVTGQFTNLQGVSGVFTSQVSGSTITGNTVLVSTLTGVSGTFVRVSGTTVTGITGLFQTVTALTGTFINTISIPSISTTGDIIAGGNLFISGNGIFSSGIVVSGQISGNSITGITGTFGDLTSNNIYGLTSVSGNLITGVTGAFTQVTATTGTFTTRLSGNTITGNSISGTSGVFVSGIFANVSGTVVTGNTGRFSEITGVSGTFTSNISGQTVTGVTGSFTSLNGVSGVFTDNLSGSVITGDTGRFTTLSGITGVFTSTLSGATVTGGSANFTSITGVNATIANTLSGATVTGSNASFTRITGVSGVFTTQLSGQNVVGENATFNYITGTTRVEGGTISGATVTGNVGLFTNLTGVSGVFTSRVSGAYITGVTIEAVTVTAITGNFTTANFTQTTTGNILASGFISGVSGLFTASNVSGIGSGIFGGGVFTTGTVSGTTVTGATGLFTSITGVSGVFTSQLSGTVITGDTGNFTTLNVETAIISTGIVRQNITVTGNIQTSGTLSVGQTATIASGLTVSGGTISGVTFTGASGQFTVLTGNTAGFTTVTGATGVFTSFSGTTVNVATGVFTSFSGTTVNVATGVFTSFSGTTVNVATGVFASGTAASPSITFSGDLNTGIYSPGADQVAISTGGSGRLFVDSSGNVGVGISPAYTFHVSSSSTSSAAFKNPGAANTQVLVGNTAGDTVIRTLSTGDGLLFSDTGKYLAFGTNGASERLRITSAGLVGVGTSAPQAELNVAKTGGAATVYIESDATNNATTSILRLGGAIGRSASIQGFRGASSNVHSLDFYTYNSADVFGMRLTPTGLGIGTSTVDGNVHIADGTRANLILKKTGLNDVTNSSLHTTYDVMQLGAGGSFASYNIETATADTQIGHNFYRHSGGTYRYKYTDTAARVSFNSPGGAIIFERAASGTANTDITFSESMRLDSSGRLGIGTTTPEGKLEVSAGNAEGLRLSSPSFLSTSQGPWIAFNGGPSAGWDLARVQGIRRGSNSEGALVFYTNNGGGAPGTISEKARIDETGRLLVGTSSSSASAAAVLQGFAGSPAGQGILQLQVGKNTAATAINENLGSLRFANSDGNIGALVSGEADLQWNSGDYPSRLVFSTTADGAASPTERMRISQNGVVTIKNGAVAEIGTLTDGVTITPDFAANCNFTVTLGGNRTLANPTNVTAGQSGSIFIVQDGTGGRTLSWGANWDWSAGSAPTLTTTANAVDRVDYVCRSATSIHAVYSSNYS